MVNLCHKLIEYWQHLLLSVINQPERPSVPNWTTIFFGLFMCFWLRWDNVVIWEWTWSFGLIIMMMLLFGGGVMAKSGLQPTAGQESADGIIISPGWTIIIASQIHFIVEILIFVNLLHWDLGQHQKKFTKKRQQIFFLVEDLVTAF